MQYFGQSRIPPNFTFTTASTSLLSSLIVVSKSLSLYAFDIRRLNFDFSRFSASYPIEGLLCGISCLNHKLSVSYASFKNNIKKDKTLLDKLSFAKESCLITNKDDDFYYFWIFYSIYLIQLIYFILSVTDNRLQWT